eukprot:12797421-Alexandrium_andersonii.AAC.1
MFATKDEPTNGSEVARPPPVRRDWHARLLNELLERRPLRDRIKLAEEPKEIGQRLERVQDLEYDIFRT